MIVEFLSLHASLCVVGIILSIYALHVELEKEKNKSYVALCDFSDRVSCTKAFSSYYGKGFGLLQHIVGEDSILIQPNSVLGIIFYVLQLVLGYVGGSLCVHLLFYTSVLSCLGCVWLAYVLYFILQDTCVVCISTYLINFAIMFVNYQTFAAL
ncbi:PREDICTED: vitamin K epoxide reductase complex subunit 1-like protein 1 [Branchiostoma belcheri]|uniref:vitamin-K-epoxide reductase (warfarin-sensitive) n=1 Tax=Branchiostoma belcheri TaxID=7741 RepID=A0A6P4XS83_BRABE|nr:PREDICTED: vitamin K epoxide reductase complex subunit 1-like protein 1 [Branchiostoma belcheri]